MVSGLEGRVTALEKGSSTTKAPTATPAPAAGDGDDDFDLFGDDDVIIKELNLGPQIIYPSFCYRHSWKKNRR